MRLQEILGHFSEERIKRLVTRRQLSLVVDDLRDLRTVAHYLSRERNFFLAYSGLPRDVSRLLLEIKRHGGQSSITGKRRLLQPLAAEGLVFLLPAGNPQKSIIPDEYLFYLSRIDRGPHPTYNPSEKNSILDCLQGLDDGAILELAERLLPHIETEHPARMAAEMKAFLEERENVDSLLRHLSAGARQVFQHLLDCGGRVPLAAVRAHFGDQVGPLFGYYSKTSGREKPSPLDELERVGLVFRIGRRDSCILLVPYEVYDHFLREILSRKEARRRDLLEKTRHEQVEPAKVRPASPRMENDLLSLLLAVRSSGLRATRRGTPHKQDLGRILHYLKFNEMDRVIFLVGLAVEMGFLKLAQDGTGITREAEKWFDNREPKKLRSLFSTWLHMSRWDEIRVQTGFGEEDGSSAQHESLLSSLRYLVKDTLAALDEKGWISLRTFLLLCRQDPDFGQMVYLLEVARHVGGKSAKGAWAPGRRSGAGAAHVFEADTDSVFEKMLRSLHYLGLLDLGLDRHNRLLAIRKTVAGRAILRGQSVSQDFPHPDAGKLTVQPNLEIIAPTELPLRLHLSLASFCDVSSIDRVVIYCLSPATLAKAVNGDKPLKEFRLLLQEHSKQPLPRTVEMLFTGLERRQGEIELGYAGGFLRVRDPFLLAELQSRQVLERVVAEQASDTVVLLKPNIDLEGLQRSLRGKGYFVRLAESESETKKSSNTR